MLPILEIQNISKKFRINHEQQPYLSIRDSLSNMFKPGSTKEDFWALKDVSFNVEKGDTIAIVGRNGAGKSTLLKILSKITPPTSGQIIGRGRIASLLEVGTGFHTELSGRENIFMNGSILGMRRVEILRNFDSIVEFAGIEKFVDTPLKHYSSGMQLRLAFAVAAFLENEVLIIDEVLAVGDAAFQKKCLHKIEEVSGDGRTIIFVSHAMSLVSAICEKTIWLSKGSVHAMGKTKEIIDQYIRSIESNDDVNIQDRIRNNGPIKIKSISTINENGEKISAISFNEKWKLVIEFETDTVFEHFIVALSVKNFLEVTVRTSWLKAQPIEKGSYKVIFESDDLLLEEGGYQFSLGFSNYERAVLLIDDIISLKLLCNVDMSKFGILRSSGSGIILNQMKSHLIKEN